MNYHATIRLPALFLLRCVRKETIDSAINTLESLYDCDVSSRDPLGYRSM